jgi:hypothetical protein
MVEDHLQAILENCAGSVKDERKRQSPHIIHYFPAEPL